MVPEWIPERRALPDASRPGSSGLVGSSEGEAGPAAGRSCWPRPQRLSRSYASIVRANVMTVFNALLAGFGALTLAFGDRSIGITPQEF